MSLPILVMEDGALSPRFGYVFRKEWVKPYESLLGMLWKFTQMNRLPGHSVVTQLCSRPTDPYEGIAITDVDVKRVARLLGIAQFKVRAGIGKSAKDASPFFRHCTSCMALGYHCRLYQYERHFYCPIHRLPLRAECCRCGRPSAYWLDAQLLDAPFRCRHCGAYYSHLHGTTPKLWSNTLATAKKRTALSRITHG